MPKYEAQLAAEPNNFKMLRSVAELYTQRKDFDRALEAYNRIVAQEGATDPSLLKAISETTIKKYEAALAALDPNAPDYAEKSAQIKSERDAFLLAETKQRADRYPNDLGIRFELGETLLQAGPHYRGDAGISEGAGQSSQASPGDELPGPMLCPEGDE